MKVVWCVCCILSLHLLATALHLATAWCSHSPLSHALGRLSRVSFVTHIVETLSCVTSAHSSAQHAHKAECVFRLPSAHSAYLIAVQVLEPSLSASVPYCLLLRALAHDEMVPPLLTDAITSSDSLLRPVFSAVLVGLASIATLLWWRACGHRSHQPGEQEQQSHDRSRKHAREENAHTSTKKKQKKHTTTTTTTTTTNTTRSKSKATHHIENANHNHQGNHNDRKANHTQDARQQKERTPPTGEASRRRHIHHQRSRSALPTPVQSAAGVHHLTALPSELNGADTAERAKRRERWRRSRGKQANSSGSSDSLATSGELSGVGGSSLQTLSPAQWQQWTEGMRDRGLLILGADDLTLRERIGSGAHGSVYCAEYRGEVVAAKQLSRSSSAGARAFRREVELLRSLKHRNLLCMRALAVLPPLETTGDGDGLPRIYMIADYVSGGDLFQYLRKLRTRLSGGGDGVRGARHHSVSVGGGSTSCSGSGGLSALQPPLGDELVADWARDICAGMCYLHAQRPHPILHRDLKSPNVLVRMPTPSSDETRPSLLICDFGLSKVHENTFANTMVGTGR
jgi:Protein tyrosine and serine/threonine kinase